MNIIITGAGRGIGFELVKHFSEESGHNIFAVSRNILKLEKLAKVRNTNNAKGNLHVLGFDLLSEEYCDVLVPSITEKLGSIDILINNAGMLLDKPFEEISDHDFDRIFDLNIKSPFRLIRDLIPLFSQPAHVVNITSMGGVMGSTKFPGLSIYSASKGALSILTECLAEELKEKQIKVNALALGAVQTEMLSEAFPEYKAPLQPEKMAEFIRYFATTGHSYFNGKILPVSVSTP